MISKFWRATAVLLVIITAFVLIAFLRNSRNPALVMVGENSPFTWLSGVLLIVASTISATISLRENWLLWFIVSGFFFVLAVDERFMIHEAIKDRMMFRNNGTAALWVNEIAVLVGSVAGVVISLMMFRKFDRSGRIMLIATVTLGCASVVIDIFTFGAIVEEICKILAELTICLALVNHAVGKKSSDEMTR